MCFLFICAIFIYIFVKIFIMEAKSHKEDDLPDVIKGILERKEDKQTIRIEIPFTIRIRKDDGSDKEKK